MRTVGRAAAPLGGVADQLQVVQEPAHPFAGGRLLLALEVRRHAIAVCRPRPRTLVKVRPQTGVRCANPAVCCCASRARRCSAADPPPHRRAPPHTHRALAPFPPASRPDAEPRSCLCHRQLEREPPHEALHPRQCAARRAGAVGCSRWIALRSELHVRAAPHALRRGERTGALPRRARRGDALSGGGAGAAAKSACIRRRRRASNRCFRGRCKSCTTRASRG